MLAYRLMTGAVTAAALACAGSKSDHAEDSAASDTISRRPVDILLTIR